MHMAEITKIIKIKQFRACSHLKTAICETSPLAVPKLCSVEGRTIILSAMLKHENKK